MLLRPIVLGAVLSIYSYLVYLFYSHEKQILLAGYVQQRDLYIARETTPLGVIENEVAIILGLISFMALGYISGIKKAAFTLFLYNVPFKMLRGEYEKGITTDGKLSTSSDPIVVGLALFLTVFGALELFDYGKIRQKKAQAQ